LAQYSPSFAGNHFTSDLTTSRGGIHPKISSMKPPQHQLPLRLANITAEIQAYS